MYVTIVSCDPAEHPGRSVLRRRSHSEAGRHPVTLLAMWRAGMRARVLDLY